MAHHEPYFWGPHPPADPAAAISHLTEVDPALGRVIERAGPLRLEPTTGLSPAHYLQRSIVYQQLSGKAAGTIYRRFLDLFGGRPPSAARVLATDQRTLRSAGLSTAKAAAIVDLARHTEAGRIPPRPALYRLSAEAAIERLTVVKGIGRWTVEMLLIFYLGHADVLPLGDLGVRMGFARTYRKRKPPTPVALARHGRRWAPYRSVASWYLWRALELPPE